jgi:hypothetical protein
MISFACKSPCRSPLPEATASQKGRAKHVAIFFATVIIALPLVRSLSAQDTVKVPTQGPGVSDEMAVTFRQRNGEVFEGWQKPKAVLVFTGELDGYIEPCGCTGMENQ